MNGAFLFIWYIYIYKLTNYGYQLRKDKNVKTW